MTNHRLDVLDIIERIIAKEGDFVDHPHDKGGPTRYGITEKVARSRGYAGPMSELPKPLAEKIYFFDYYIEPGFDRIALLSPGIAYELTDTGVNMGQGTAARFLQRCLNVFNRMGEIYPDIKIDGSIGDKTIAALCSYLQHRGEEGEIVFIKSLNCLQGARCIHLSEIREKNETFTYGWIRERVNL